MATYNKWLQDNNKKLAQLKVEIENLPKIKVEQEKLLNVTQNGTQVVTPDEGSVLNKVTVNTIIPETKGKSYGREIPTLEFDKTEILLGKDKKSDTFTIDTNSTGTLAVESLNPTVATAALDGKTVTVESVNDSDGNATVQVKVEKTDTYLAAIKEIGVIAKFVSKVLNENSWDVIKSVSDKGQGENFWKVGDTKTITINGQVGNTNFSNLSIDAFIIGFNHNAGKEGENRIHFLIGKSGGKLVGLYDNKYGPDAGWPEGSSGSFMMNTTNTSAGGWDASYMRKTILGGDQNPNSPLPNSLLAALPPDLRAVMKPVTKYTDNIGDRNNNTPDAVTATIDYLFLLTWYEITGGKIFSANSNEEKFQAQYEYFTSKGITTSSAYAYKYSSTNAPVIWWLRSPDLTQNNGFCCIDDHGCGSRGRSSLSQAVLAGFAA